MVNLDDVRRGWSTRQLRERGERIAGIWLDQIRYLTIEPDPDTVARIRDHVFWDKACPDCGAELGEQHAAGCDVARCLADGTQRLSCCEDHDCGSQIWDGVWPGTEEAVNFGLYTRWERGWHPCGPERPGASPDLNEINQLACEWDRARQQWVPFGPNPRRAARERTGALARAEDRARGAVLMVPWPPDDAPGHV